MAKKFPDLTGDGKVTQADILKGRGVPGFKDGKSVELTSRVPRRKKAQKRRSQEARKQSIQEMKDLVTKSRGRGQLDKFTGRGVDLDALPSSMKYKTDLGTFIKKEKFPETKFEMTELPEKTKVKRARAEKKVQEKMGSFESGGVVKAAILVIDSGPQSEKAQIKGTKFSGTF